MDSFIADNFPLHVKVNQQPNTSPEAIEAFLATNRMHSCQPYNTTMTADACIRRRRMAYQVPRQGYHHSSRETWRSDVYMKIDKCVACRSYARPVPKAVPAKYGKCACGCGREGRLVARGMASACYQRYIKRGKG